MENTQPTNRLKGGGLNIVATVPHGGLIFSRTWWRQGNSVRAMKFNQSAYMVLLIKAANSGNLGDEDDKAPEVIVDEGFEGIARGFPFVLIICPHCGQNLKFLSRAVPEH